MQWLGGTLSFSLKRGFEGICPWSDLKGEESHEQTRRSHQEAVEKSSCSPLDGSHPYACAVSARTRRRAAGTFVTLDPSRMGSWASREAQSARTDPDRDRCRRH